MITFIFKQNFKLPNRPANNLSQLLCAVMASCWFAPPAHAQTIPIEDFARLPTMRNVSIAPGGQKVMAKVNVDNVYTLVTYDLSEGYLNPIYAMAQTDEIFLRLSEWVSVIK